MLNRETVQNQNFVMLTPTGSQIRVTIANTFRLSADFKGEQYTLFERTAAPARPAVVTDLPINFICEGKPINQTVDRLVKGIHVIFAPNLKFQ